MHDARACALYESALALWNTGFIAQARRKLDVSIAHANELSLPANLADSFGYAGILFHLLRDPPRAYAYAARGLQISLEKGYRNSGFLNGMVLGWSLAAQGHLAEGILQVEQTMAASNGSFGHMHRSQFAVLFAETYMLAGRHSEAIRVSEAGLTEFSRFRDLVCAPDLWTLKGEALHALGAADDQVEACYGAALTLARELRAKGSELRAAIGLARLRRRQGRPAEGYRLLHEVYGWFTEGFDAADLQIAARLLDELSVA